MISSLPRILLGLFAIPFIYFSSMGTAWSECVSGNCQDGIGKFIYQDGGEYIGSFKDGVRSGQGTYAWSTGAKYRGMWKSGVQHGPGTSYGSDGNVIFSGTWDHGQQVAIASNTLPSDPAAAAEGERKRSKS